MKSLAGSIAVLLALTATARADRLPMSGLDVTIPDGWTLNEDPVLDMDLVASMAGLTYVRKIFTPPEWTANGFEPMCALVMVGLFGDKDFTFEEKPTWAPAGYADTTARGVFYEVESTVLCAAHPDGGAMTVIVTPSRGTYADLAPMLEAILGLPAAAVTYADPVPVDTSAYIPAEEAPAIDEPIPEPAPKRTPTRDRALRVGLGLAYLAPGQMQESGYGLAASAGFHVGATHARWRGEASGMFGVDSNAGLWADVHAHAIVRLVGDGVTGFTLSAHGGAGVDGIGKANTERKVSVPYAVSPQLGLRVARLVDDGAYGLEGTFAVRFPNEPGGALRVGLSRDWDGPRRLASVSVRYLRYADVVGQVSMMIGIRL